MINPSMRRKNDGRNPLERAENYERANRSCAEIILANPERHGGADAFPAIRARCFLERLAGNTSITTPGPAVHRDQASLFGGAA